MLCLRRALLSALVATTWLLFTPVVASANGAPSVAGLRLGMTAEEVVHALGHAGISPSRVQKKACVNELLALHRSVVGMEEPGSCMQDIFAPYESGDLLVFFSEDLPARPGVAVVTTLSLNYVAEPAIQAVMAQAGPPSVTDRSSDWIVAIWCFGFTCTSMDHWDKPTLGPMLLVHRGSGLTLVDPKAQAQSSKAVSDILAAHGVTQRP